ncbi:MAG: flavodoxin [Firmicutes bacterium]|nr:flavodoxin [Bacillota bacterium]
MKTILVYYSLDGNTDFAAKKIAAATGGDTLRLFPKKAYPTSGFGKFFRGGMHAVLGKKPPLETYAFDAAAYDRVILGFPVWAGHVAPPLLSFLRDNDLSGKQIAAFACQSGSGGEKALAQLKSCLGREELDAERILIDPKSKPSPENEQKIREFCEKLR